MFQLLYVSTWLSYGIFATSSLGIVGAGLSLAYIQTKLRMNNQIKAVFSLITLENLIAFVISTIGHVIMVINNDQDFVSCSLMLYPLIINASGNLVKSGTISSLRYFMSWKATKQRLTNKIYIWIFIVGQEVVHWSLMIIMHYLIHVSEGPVSQAEACAEKKRPYNGKDQYLIIIIGIYNIIWIGVGVASDVRLAMLIKKRNKVANNSGADLIPWKSANPEDSGVPIRATLVGTMSLLLFVASMGIMLFGLAENDLTSAGIINLIMTAWLALHAPTMVILTVKQKKAKEMKQPPKELQFHDEDEGQENKDMFEESMAYFAKISKV